MSCYRVCCAYHTGTMYQQCSCVVHDANQNNSKQYVVRGTHRTGSKQSGHISCMAALFVNSCFADFVKEHTHILYSYIRPVSIIRAEPPPRDVDTKTRLIVRSSQRRHYVNIPTKMLYPRADILLRSYHMSVKCRSLKIRFD